MPFSVLMSVYKKEQPAYLDAALKSVFSQTLPPDEVLLIKDGPLTEELERVIAEYGRQYAALRTYRFAENVQLGRALAKGVELCSNELVARMDTDDIAVSDRFEKQYRYMQEHSEIAACGGWLEEFNDAGTYSKVKRMPESGAELMKYARYRNPLNHMTVMFRRSEVLSAGNYEHFPLLEDYYLWSRMLAAGGTFYNFPCVLVRMRTNDGVYGRRGGADYFRQYRRLRKKQRELGLLKPREYVTALALTAGMTLQPAWIRKIMYRRVLRKQSEQNFLL